MAFSLPRARMDIYQRQLLLAPRSTTIQYTSKVIVTRDRRRLEIRKKIKEYCRVDEKLALIVTALFNAVLSCRFIVYDSL